jgi:branched-chain amino acid transport system substrate-binding protein
MFSLIVLMLPVLVAEPIRVGAIFAKTGVAAVSNLSHLPGLYLAQEEINADGGLLGRPIEITVYDTESTSYGAQMAAEQASLDGVVAVIGSVWSSHSLAAARVLQERQIPMISPSSTSSEVTRAGDYIFRACYVDLLQGAIMADFAFNDLAGRRAAVLTNSAKLYSTNLSDVFARRFVELGGRVVLSGEYVNNTSDFRGFIGELLASDAQIVFLPSSSAQAIVVLRQARGMGATLPFLGGDGWSHVIDRYQGHELRDAYYSDHWHEDLPGERNSRFVEAINERYGPIGNSGVPLTYDAMMLLADAITRAASVDGAAVRQALAETTDFSGVTGMFTMDQWGDPQKSAVVVSFSEDEAVLVRATSY